MSDSLTNEWLEKIGQQKISGKNAAAWCRENEINYQNFIKWRQRLAKGENLTRSSFVESVEASDEPWMEITMYGSKITLTKKFNRESMRHLLEVLKGL